NPLRQRFSDNAERPNSLRAISYSTTESVSPARARSMILAAIASFVRSERPPASRALHMSSNAEAIAEIASGSKAPAPTYGRIDRAGSSNQPAAEPSPTY